MKPETWAILAAKRELGEKTFYDYYRSRAADPIPESEMTEWDREFWTKQAQTDIEDDDVMERAFEIQRDDVDLTLPFEAAR